MHVHDDGTFVAIVGRTPRNSCVGRCDGVGTLILNLYNERPVAIDRPTGDVDAVWLWRRVAV